ncbi:VWA domain-containing protein [Glaciecola sp. MF2-115]|uniref:vWA domain-containing protein n=1 Tax=Glaciecola sp. MF2-115 TaxID=3384827 RepID=UPI0039A08A27
MIDWQAFHFVRPEWLIAIVPLVIIALLLTRFSSKQSGWQGIVSNHLYQHLVVAKDKKSYKPPFYLLGLAWVVASIAMAGPTWQKLPQPVYQVSTGKVLMLDMSMSMRATDTQPDRLTRAKFKAIDLLNSLQDGEVGLVVYAGDAFTVSPLTSDVTNITALIPSLRPEIMPIPGSNPLTAMEEAERLLTSAGYTKGEIYWISDGIELDDVPDLQSHIAKSPYRYSILGVGTQKGAPIKMLDGGFMKDARGNIVLPTLNSRYFSQVLGNSNGRYTPIQSDSSDIENMQFTAINFEQEKVNDDIMGQGDQWQDMGAYLVLLILPFAAYAFRRGILVVVLSTMMFLPSEPVYAEVEPPSDTNANASEKEVSKASDLLAGAFKNADQLGLEAYQKQNYDKASSIFDDAMWKGAALYKNKDYEAALETFQKVPGAESAYNQGNALARLGQLEKAIEKYEEALQERPGHSNAMANKKLVEELLNQQQEQNQDGENQNGEDQQSGDSDKNDQESGEQSNGEQEQGEQENGKQNSSEQQDQQSKQQENSEQDGQQNQNEESKDSEEERNKSEQQEEAKNESDEAKENEGGSEGESAEQKNNLKQQKAVEDMTPEEKEQMQRMQMLMNKVPDDPAFLLQRKMLLESQKRRSERFSKPNKKDW